MRRLALLVGVDEYLHVRQLQSCVHDAQHMARTLIEAHGFLETDCTLLLNAAATRDAILAGLKALRRRAGPQDVVLFYFSGHGSQVLKGYRTELDGWSESIVPVDSGRQPWPNRDITDLEIYRWVRSVSEITANIVVIADSCFAGGVVRDSQLGNVRESGKGIEPDYRLPSPVAGAGRPAGHVYRGEPPAGAIARPNGFLRWADESYVLLAACKSGETAKELQDQRMSAFTWLLCTALRSVPPGSTYRDLVDEVCQAVPGMGVEKQTPHAENARDRVLWSERWERPSPFVAVRRGAGGSLDMEGGAAHGIRPGSLWTVHPPTTRHPDAARAPLAIVRAGQVGAVVTRVEVVEQQAAIPLGARAFAHQPEALLRVALESGAASPQQADEMAAAFAGSPIVTLTPAAPAAAGDAGSGVRICAVEPRSGATATLRVEQPSWAVLDASGELMLPPVARARDDAAEILRRSLEDWARADLLRRLTHDRPDLLELARPKVELLARAANGRFVQATPGQGGQITYRAGDSLALSVSHSAPWPLYLYVFSIGALGAVHLLDPVPGSTKALAPGHRFTLGQPPDPPLQVSLPQGFQAMADAGGPSAAQDSIKLFLTTACADVCAWPVAPQDGWRELPFSGNGSPRPDEANVFGAGGGTAGATRDGSPLRGDAAAVAPDAWAAITLCYRVPVAPAAGGG